MHGIGKGLIVFGILLIILGVFFTLGGKIPWFGFAHHKWFGRLPGDIIIHKKNVTFYFPVITCILISIVLSLVFFLFFKHR